jgi:hypothetical protein
MQSLNEACICKWKGASIESTSLGPLAQVHEQFIMNPRFAWALSECKIKHHGSCFTHTILLIDEDTNVKHAADDICIYIPGHSTGCTRHPMEPSPRTSAEFCQAMMRRVYFRRCYEDFNVVPYDPLTLFRVWGAHMNIQRATSGGWSHCLLKYTMKCSRAQSSSKIDVDATWKSEVHAMLRY